MSWWRMHQQAFVAEHNLVILPYFTAGMPWLYDAS
jgi:hypothetical protein